MARKKTSQSHLNTTYATTKAKKRKGKRRGRPGGPVSGGNPRFRGKTASDALFHSTGNDPVYNIRNIFARKASNDAKALGNGGNYNFNRAGLPLPKRFGAVDTSPFVANQALKGRSFYDMYEDGRQEVITRAGRQPQTHTPQSTGRSVTAGIPTVPTAPASPASPTAPFNPFDAPDSYAAPSDNAFEMFLKNTSRPFSTPIQQASREDSSIPFRNGHSVSPVPHIPHTPAHTTVHRDMGITPPGLRGPSPGRQLIEGAASDARHHGAASDTATAFRDRRAKKEKEKNVGPIDLSGFTDDQEFLIDFDSI